MKAKKGFGPHIAKIFKKLLDPEKRFRPIPPVFFYSVKEQYISINIAENAEDVNIEFRPGDKFKDISDAVWATFKSYGLDLVAKDGFNFETVFTSPDSFLSKAASFARCEDQFFFPHLLDSGEMKLIFDKKPNHISVFDSLLKDLIPNRKFFNFSCIDMIDAEVEIDLDQMEVTFRI